MHSILGGKEPFVQHSFTELWISQELLCSTCTCIWKVSVSHSAMSTSLVPRGCSSPCSSVSGILQARILEGDAIPPPRDLLDPEIDPGSPAPQADSLPSEHQGSPWCCSHFGTLLIPKQKQIPWCVKALVIQLYPTLHNPMDCSLPGFSIHGIPQARILEWVAISFPKVPWTYIWN